MEQKDEGTDDFTSWLTLYIMISALLLSGLVGIGYYFRKMFCSCEENRDDQGAIVSSDMKSNGGLKPLKSTRSATSKTLPIVVQIPSITSQESAITSKTAKISEFGSTAGKSPTKHVSKSLKLSDFKTIDTRGKMSAKTIP